MRHLILALLAGFILSGTAFADIIATYKYETGEQITLSIRDPKQIRMDVSEQSYMLLSGDKIYSVNKGEDGQWMVMDMDQMKGMAAGFMGSSPKKTYSASYQKTGRTETIAGYTGTVYLATLLENGKAVQKDEVVLSTHGDLEKVNQAWAAIGSRMGQLMGNSMAEGLEQLTQIGYGGMLRYGTQMQLQHLKKAPLADGHYQLPKDAQALQMGGMPGMAQDQETGESKEPGALEQDARDVGQAARDEAKDATIEEVREGVRSVFKGIFN